MGERAFTIFTTTRFNAYRVRFFHPFCWCHYKVIMTGFISYLIEFGQIKIAVVYL